MEKNPIFTVLMDPDTNSDCDKELWDATTQLIIPMEGTQVLPHESAAILGAQTFLKIARLPYTLIERTNATDISPNGKVPVLKCGKYVVSGLEGICQLAQLKGTSLSDNLSPTQKADIQAYMSLVKNVLGNSLLYFTWLDNGVYKNLTRVRAGSPYNFPLNILMPWFIRSSVVASLKNLNWEKHSLDDATLEVKTCLLALSERLGKADYFFGDSPTELDALVYGYLTAMVKTPLPDNKLKVIVEEQPNLIKFCNNLEKIYLTL